MSTLLINAPHADDQTIQQADLILKNATVLTMNDEREMFERGTVVVKDKKIAAVGDNALAETFHAQNILDVGISHNVSANIKAANGVAPG
jgi:hypothetical protein